MSEAQEQAAVIKWTEYVRQKYPLLKLLYHVPNERKCSEIQGAQLKRIGVKRGVPDLCLPVARGQYHGLYIEMKTTHGTTSAEQKWWGAELLGQGYYWEVCHGWELASKVLEWYMNLGDYYDSSRN
jgi:hypothetical protein